MQRSEVDPSPSESPSETSPESEGGPAYVSGLRSGGAPRPPAPRNLPGMMPGQPPIVPGLNPLGRSNPAIAPMGFLRPPMAISPPMGSHGSAAGHSWGRGQAVGGGGGGGEGEERREQEDDRQQEEEMDVEEGERFLMEQAEGMVVIITSFNINL